MSVIILLFHDGLSRFPHFSCLSLFFNRPFFYFIFSFTTPYPFISLFLFLSFHHSQTFPGLISLLALFRPWTSTRCNNAAIMQLAKEIAGLQLM